MTIKFPNRRRHSYVQTITASPEQVFPLLCPVREADWVSGWDPHLVLSDSGVAETDCVFVTPAEPHPAIWVITVYDPERYVLEMIKVTPGHTVAKLEIVLRKAGEGRTAAEVAYTYTSLGPEGDAFLAEFTVDWYREFMTGWEKALNHYLETGEKLNE